MSEILSGKMANTAGNERNAKPVDPQTTVPLASVHSRPYWRFGVRTIHSLSLSAPRHACGTPTSSSWTHLFAVATHRVDIATSMKEFLQTKIVPGQEEKVASR
jgi:hypothetical protein